MELKIKAMNLKKGMVLFGDMVVIEVRAEGKDFTFIKLERITKDGYECGIRRENNFVFTVDVDIKKSCSKVVKKIKKLSMMTIENGCTAEESKTAFNMLINQLLKTSCFIDNCTEFYM